MKYAMIFFFVFDIQRRDLCVDSLHGFEHQFMIVIPCDTQEGHDTEITLLSNCAGGRGVI